MVRYSIDTDERNKVYFYLAVISIGASFLMGRFKDVIPYQLLAPSGFMVFAVLLATYAKYIWKWATKFGLSSIPNLNGVWIGKVTKIGDDGFESKMTITQNWEKIDIALETSLTTGTVEVVGLFIENKKLQKLKLIYHVRARTLDIEDYHPNGEGVNELIIRQENGKISMDGFYYSSKKSTGKLNFQKVN